MTASYAGGHAAWNNGYVTGDSCRASPDQVAWRSDHQGVFSGRGRSALLVRRRPGRRHCDTIATRNMTDATHRETIQGYLRMAPPTP